MNALFYEKSVNKVYHEKKKKCFFNPRLTMVRLEGRASPHPPPPPFFHFPTAASLTRVIVECTSLVGEYKPAYAALAVKYFFNTWRESSYSCAGIDILYLFRLKLSTGTSLTTISSASFRNVVDPPKYRVRLCK